MSVPDWLDLERLERTEPLRRWDRFAACIGKPRWWWFPERGDNQADAHQKAKAICRACPVRYACLRVTMDMEKPNSRHGWWAGTTTRQRDAIARARRLLRAGRAA